MSSNIEQRVLSIAFDNKQFEAGIAQTLKSLEKLDTSLKAVGKNEGLNNVAAQSKKIDFKLLNSAVDKTSEKLRFKDAGEGLKHMERDTRLLSFDTLRRSLDIVRSKVPLLKSHFDALTATAGKGLHTVQDEANRLNLHPVAASVDTISHRFGAMRVAATTAFATIVNRATNAAGRLVKSFTIDPIKEGFKGYETQINAIQTIQANTGLTGKKGMKAITGTLKELQTYANKTVYNFADMAKNIGTFTAAGVKLKPATASIKGIANLAALSGSSAQQASGAMYQLSQAIASGKVGLQDYNSVVNAGIGGKVFQKSIIQSAIAMGTLDKNAVKLNKSTGQLTINGESFRNAISAKNGAPTFFTSGVLTNALSTFTGDMTLAQLKAKGYSTEVAKAILKQGKLASDAATKIKTLSQLSQALKEEVATAFGNVFRSLFGGLGSARAIFSKLHTTIENALTGPINNFADKLQKANKLGLRNNLIQGFKNIGKAFDTFVRPIAKGFRDVFPASTPKSLAELSKRFAEFTAHLKIAPETASLLRRVFAGLFAVMHLGYTVVKNLTKTIIGLFGATAGSNEFLTLAASIGDFFVSLDKGVGKANSFREFFQTLGDSLAGLVHLFGVAAGAVTSLFSGDTAGGKRLQATFDKLTKSGTPLGETLKFLQRVMNGLGNALSKLHIADAFNHIGSAINGFFTAVGSAVSSDSVSHFSNILQAGLSGGILIALRKALSGDLLKHGLRFDATGGLLKNLMGTVHQFNGVLKAMQTELKAKALLEIAAAIGVLAASMFLLSKIEPSRLMPATKAVGAAAGILVGAIGVLSKVGGKLAAIQLPLMAAGLIALAFAVDLLSIAIFAFSKIPAEDLKKGLYGVAGALAALGIGLKFITKGPSLLFIGPGLITVALALDLLTVALRAIGQMSWEEIKKGLTGVGVSLYAIGIGLKRMGPSLILTGPGLVATAIGLNFMAGALRAIGQIRTHVLVKGIFAVSAALYGIALAMRAMPKSLLIQAAAMVVISLSLTALVGVIKTLGSLSVGGIIKSLLTLRVALGILKTALDGLKESFFGSIALRGISASLLVLAGALKIYSKLSLKTLALGLFGFASTIIAIGFAGKVAAPGLAALGYSMIPLGLGVASVSSGLLIFAFALKLAGAEGARAVGVLAAAVAGVAVLIPQLVVGMVKGILDGIIAFGKALPDLTQALYTILDTLLSIIIREVPRLGEAFLATLFEILKVLNAAAGPLLEAGAKLLLSLLAGLDQHLPEILAKGGNVVFTLLVGMRQQLPRILDEGARVLRAFLDGIARNLGGVVKSAFSIGNRFLEGIAKNVPGFIAAGAKALRSFLDSITKQIPSVFHSGANLIIEFLRGIGNEAPRIIKTAYETVRQLLRAIGDKEQVKKTVATGFNTAINFIDGITEGLKSSKGIQRLLHAAFELGKQIAKQVLHGLGDIANQIEERINPFDHRDEIAKADEKITADIDRINAEHQRKYGLAGKDAADGYANGIKEHGHKAAKASKDMAEGSLQATKKHIKSKSPSRAFHELGGFAAGGYSKGIADNAHHGAKASGDMVDASANAANKKLKNRPTSKVFHDIGKNTLAGFELGIVQNSGLAISSISGLFGNIISGTRQQLGIHSPSQVFADIARNIVDGLTIGLFGFGVALNKGVTQPLKQMLKETGDQKEFKKFLDGSFLKGFKLGDPKELSSSQQKVVDTFKTLRTKLKEEQGKLKEDLSKDRDKLQQLMSADHPDEKAIKALFRAIGAKEELLKQSRKASSSLIKATAAERQAMLVLAGAYDDVVQKIADAKDYIKSVTEQYDALPDFDSGLQDALDNADLTYAERLDKRREEEKKAEKLAQIDQVALYKKALQEKIDANIKFNDTLEKLRKLGLDQQTIEKFVQDGTGDLGFMQQLLQGGASAVQAINTLDGQLKDSAGAIGEHAGEAMYGAGVDMSKGLIAGLQSQADVLKALMDGVAAEMVATIKKALGIKSPSRVFAEVGQYSIQGLAEGLSDKGGIVSGAASNLGDEAVAAMTQSLASMSNAVVAEIRPDLTITPVLDLTQVKKDASKLADLTQIAPIETTAQAQQVSTETQVTQADQAAAAAAAAPSFEFNQYNTSPEALDDVTIYRQSKNQFSQIKNALGVPSK